MSSDEKAEDSRFSFITVSSLVDGQENQVNKMKNTMIDYPRISEELKPKQDLVSMSMSGIEQEKHEFMPLQINQNKNQKLSQPHLVIEDKGEKKD
jgi:hypothetical protein